MKTETIKMPPLERCRNALQSIQNALTAVFGIGRTLEAQNSLRPTISVELVNDKHSDPCLKIDGWIFLTPVVKSPLIKRKMLNGSFRPDVPAWEVTSGVWEASGHRDEPDHFDVVEIDSDGSLPDAIRVAAGLVAKQILNSYWEEQGEREQAVAEVALSKMYEEQEKHAAQQV